MPAWFEDVDLCARLVREGKILFWPDARFRHRGGVSSAALGYGRFLPIFYRNALLYRRLHYGRGARLLYRPLLATGMLLRLAALPFRPRVPRSRKESARAYLSTLAVALGVSHPELSTLNSQPSIVNQSMIDVSIIVVAHNDEADLPVSVGSALAQRGVVTETLIVDNDSGDGSRDVVRRVVGDSARLLELPETWVSRRR